MLLVGLGRVVQDLLLWCTMEFGYLRLGDGFVQASSIMPQKRNPVALEHARAIGSKAVGQAQAIVTAVHNTPFGDIVDTEDDLQPLVASMFRDATRTVTLVAAAMRGADFDVARLAARAGDGGTTLTELADTLVRDTGCRSARRTRIAGAAAEGAHRGSARVAVADARRRRRRRCSARRSTTPRSGSQHDHEPAALRRGAHDPRRAGARRDRPRASPSRARQLDADRAAWQARRDRARRAPSAQLAARVRAL